MTINYGKQFEIDFIEATNEKKFNELSDNLKNIIKFMYPNIKDNQIIKTGKCDPYGKPDVKLCVEGENHYLSLKTNTSKHVHSESLDLFVEQLVLAKMSSKTINTIKKFHYGDGTLDGTGTIRATFDELFPTMITDIKKANEELNFSNDLMVKIVDKFVFVGNSQEKPSADYIYHGSLNFGVICSRKQVIKHLRRRNYDFMRNLHIGPLQFHPYARYANFKDRNPYKRNIVNFVWVNFVSDLEYISEHYSNF